MHFYWVTLYRTTFYVKKIQNLYDVGGSRHALGKYTKSTFWELANQIYVLPFSLVLDLNVTLVVEKY